MEDPSTISSMPILIHPEAEKRFNELGEELVGEVVPVNLSKVRAEKHDLHPVAKFNGQNVIGNIEFTDHIIDSNGTVVGRAWTFDGRIHGLVGSGFEKCNRLSGRLTALRQ
jgi:hypothetical protein